MVKAGIFGASGYTGVELLRLCAGHPEIDVVLATGDSTVGTAVGNLYPSVRSACPGLILADPDPAAADGLDLVFLALPHGASQALVPDLRKRVGKVVDLAADFRLRDPGLYPVWYGAPHAAPELLSEFAFGIPELFRSELRGADLVAAAGCYVTAAALALAPLVRAGAIDTDGVIVDAASGVSGAGRAPKATSHFAAVDGDFTAYGLLTHRHTPEIEQATGATVLFTPHLAPMTRGILATCYARPVSGADPLDVLRDFYAGEPFVHVGDRSPSTKATTGANCVHITARRDPRTGWVVVLSALDNLVKGASGQAVQCANLALGLEETSGLPVIGLYP
ncbi:MAG TPA: N-acetyl-gamma-glutamyl-phosphate reductase [Acidimicrobiales bacterium]|nr:N-acetyl-gamma-glutamyl-phosphate reductase [Acidimicrobiales bacterium]